MKGKIRRKGKKNIERMKERIEGMCTNYYGKGKKVFQIKYML